MNDALFYVLLALAAVVAAWGAMRLTRKHQRRARRRASKGGRINLFDTD